MSWLLRLTLASALALAPSVALAQDWDFEEEEDEGEEPDSREPPPPLERLDEEDDVDDIGDPDDDLTPVFDPAAEPVDLLGDEEPVVLSGDTADEYRAAQERFKGLPEDEELREWEAYLARYPNSAFRVRIQNRMDELMDQMYGARIGTGPGSVDAMNQEIRFSAPLQLENLNPRTRLQGAFEWGLPSYFNLLVDYEHALARKFSLHAGLRRRYSGFNIEVGSHLALVKSTRTQTILTLIPDLYFKLDPAFPGARPQLALGRIFGKLHVQVQGGAEIEIRDPVAVHIIGGGNLAYMAADNVALFVETHADMKNVSTDLEPYAFRFNVISFGMKFYPSKKGDTTEQNTEVNLGATVPYTVSYWQWHFGSVMGQVNYYPDG